MRKNLPPPGFVPRTVQPVASRGTDWAIAARCVNTELPKTCDGTWIEPQDKVYIFRGYKAASLGIRSGVETSEPEERMGHPRS
jgi:hypothetical protein